MAATRLPAALLALSVWVPAGAAPPAPDPDAAALATIADRPPPPVAAATGWRLALEASLDAERDPAGASTQRLRATLDHHWDGRLASDWRAVSAGRLDLRVGDGGGEARHVWREAYLAWQPDPAQTWTFGRRVWRYGGAPGFSPGDLLRSGAYRLDAALSPFDAEQLRMGPIGLAWERRWDGGALTLLHAPRLSTRPSDGSFSVDPAATNAGERTLAVLSPRLGEALAPQLLLLHEAGRGPRWALNLSMLAGAATVLQLELAQQRTGLLPLPSQGGADEGRVRWQGSAGLTHTAGPGTVWLAAHHSAAAPDGPAWRAFSAGALPWQFAEYHALAELGQELPARHAWSVGGSWRGHAGRPLELRAFVLTETATRSRSGWFEGAWLGTRGDLALRLNLQDGAADSIYGRAPRRARATLTWRVSL